MASSRIPAALHAQLGNDATFGLLELLDIEEDDWSERVLSEATLKFDKCLTDEVSAVRVELAKGLASIREEMAGMRVDVVRWSFAFWIGEVAVIAGLITLMLRGVKP